MFVVIAIMEGRVARSVDFTAALQYTVFELSRRSEGSTEAQYSREMSAIHTLASHGVLLFLGRWRCCH